jgi:ligand-binding sensor domain-containing protein/serine phosphatase RsbU (regulator of sigma subunit)
MIRKLPFILGLLFLLLQNTYTQKLHFQEYSILQGLPQSSVFSALIDSRGFLWIGTDGGGVTRTDGINFEIFNHSNGLSGNVVRALHEDGLGLIWIGTDQGLDAYDGRSISAFSQDPFPANCVITCLSEDNNGKILAGTRDHGLFVIEIGDDTTVTALSRPEGLITSLVLDIEVSPDNRYWLSMAGGVNIVSPGEGGTEVIQLLEGINIPGNIVTCSGRDRTGNIWFGTRNRGVFCIREDAGPDLMQATVPEHLKFLEDETIYDVRWTDTASCWIATERLGLIHVNHDRILGKITRENGLPTNQVYRILPDGGEGIWIGTLGNGILYYGGSVFTKYELNPDRIGIDVYGMVEETPGEIIAATDEGLYRISSGKDPGSLSAPLAVSGMPPGSAISSIARDRSGGIWLGTNHGLYRYELDRAHYSSYNEDLSSLRINDLFVDHLDRLWVGTDNGYNVCTGNGVYFMNEETGLINNEVQTIIEDRYHNMWIGTLGGLVRVKEDYRDFDKKEGLTNLQIHSLAEGPSGSIWIGTFGGGLFVLETRSGPDTIRKVGGDDRLSSPNIYSLVWEDERTLLAGTESGFDKITVEADSICSVIHLDSGDGFCDGSNNLNAVLRSSNGNIWFGTSRSLVSFDPRASSRFASVPVAYIDDLRLNFEEQNWSLTHEVTPWFHLPENLVLPYHQNHLTFDFTAIHFNNPRDLQFSYFIDGQSKKWSPFSPERSVTIQGLPPGDYRFRLKARTKFGIESQETGFSFRIKPPFWQTAWFLTSTALLLILLVLLIIRLRVRKLQKEKARLEHIVELRTWEITQQKEQIEAQRDIVISQQQEIDSSMRYAKQIQTAILPEEQLLSTCFRDYFIFLQAQYIVSGDFYWMGRKDDHLVIVAADCTGHGVPGAFMSMLGVSFLNKTVNENGIVMPSEILNALRSEVLNVFHHQKVTEEEYRDGMDVALCSYDVKKQIMYFASANNPLYQVRKQDGEYVLTEHILDKMPVGSYNVMDPFRQKEILVLGGDALYLFSDGFRDQFGGPEGKKFMKKRFRQMLLDHQDKSMAEQKKEFQATLAEWMKCSGKEAENHPQTDDILIIGIRV